MNFEAALRNELNSIPDLASKVFPLTAIEGIKTPYLVYVSSEGTQEKYLGGYAGPKELNCQLHILNDTYSSTKDMTQQVIEKVLSWQGQVIGGVDGVMILDVSYEKPQEQYIPELYQYLSIVPITVRI